MGKQVNDDFDAVEKVNVPAGLSTEMLLQLLLKSFEEQGRSNKELAAAILESRKPYVDPNVLKQKQEALEERRKQIAVEYRQKVATKRICPHKRENGTYNIKWMAHSNNITMGVCGTCRSEFDTRNPDDLRLLRDDLKSIKNMGRSGAHAVRGAIVEA